MHLEQLSAVDTVVLDKTGTLTLGVPQVVAVRAWNGATPDQVLQAADVTLMTSDLSRLVEVLALSKRCRGVILFNFWGTVLVDSLGMGLAFFGLLAPIAAALIHVGSELAFILNSARLFGSTTGRRH